MKNTTILECRRVWKIYGPEAKGYLASQAKVITDQSVIDILVGRK